MAAPRAQHPDGRPFRIAVSGSYGGINLGDEAILRGILVELRRSLESEVTVFSRNVEDTLSRHQVERAVAIRDLTRNEARDEVERLDLLLLGGGGILYDRDAAAYLREVQLAQELGVPVMVYAVSAGPLNEPQVRELVAKTLNEVAVVTVRDREARKLLEEVGVRREITLTADPALLCEPQPLPVESLKREGLDADRRLVGFSVREPGPAAPDIDVEHYHALLANAADFMVERLEADVVFVPMERRKMDVQHSHAVVARMQAAQQATVLKGDYTSGQIMSLIGHFDFAVGMRLHFLIFAALAGVPFVALPYASKVKGLIEDLEMPSPPLSSTSVGQLLAYIDRSWDRRGELAASIERLLPELQERAQQNGRLLRELLTDRYGPPHLAEAGAQAAAES